MRRIVLVGCLCALAAAEDRAFVKITAPRDVYMHESFRVQMRIGIKTEFLKNNVLQPFQTDLDVPVMVTANWMRDLLSATIRSPEPNTGAGFALNGDVGYGTLMTEGTYTVLVVERFVTPTSEASLDFDGARLRLVFGTQFTDDFVQGRIAKDRHDLTVDEDPFVVEVKPLPAGAPPGFVGAVGTFTVDAGFARESAAVGEVISLVLKISGDGNLDLFDTPRLDALTDFHVYGTRDDRKLPVRTITYDVAAVRVPAEPWAIPFSTFDPRTGKYVLGLIPVPLEVTGGEPESTATAPAPPKSNFPFLILGAVVSAIVAVTVARKKRARREAPGPAQAFAASDDPVNALEAYLAARLDCPVARVVSPDLAARLEATGVGSDLAARAATLLERCVATRYGGGAVDAGEIRALVAELEAQPHE